MNKKSDYEINSWVASALCQYVPVIIAAQARENEDYDVADIDMSAATIHNPSGYKYYPLEVKRIMGGYNFKEDGVWRSFFTSDYYDRLIFEDSAITSGAPIWIINAEDKTGGKDNAKLNKLIEKHACLAFVAADGIVLFSPNSLESALLGYAYWFGKHTTNFKDKQIRKEKKAVINLEKGLFIKCEPPKEMLLK